MENTAKNFALQLGALVSLYISITALIILLFSIITVTFPDTANGYFEYSNASGSIRAGIAMLIVFFPVYLTLTRIVNTERRKNGGVYLNLTKWLIYLSLLIGGVAILIDLVMIIDAFLNGELTIRFILKALSFFIVVGGTWSYYISDARGYWQKHERESIYSAILVSTIVIIAIVYGFMHIEAPTEVREMKIDDQQVQDMINIQSHVEAFMLAYGSLPKDIHTAFDGIQVPSASEERADYTYTITGTNTYELCAEFAFVSKPDDSYSSTAYYTEPTKMRGAIVTWDHDAGEWCYTRSVQFEVKQ